MIKDQPASLALSEQPSTRVRTIRAVSQSLIFPGVSESNEAGDNVHFGCSLYHDDYQTFSNHGNRISTSYSYYYTRTLYRYYM